MERDRGFPVIESTDNTSVIYDALREGMHAYGEPDSETRRRWIKQVQDSSKTVHDVANSGGKATIYVPLRVLEEVIVLYGLSHEDEPDVLAGVDETLATIDEIR